MRIHNLSLIAALLFLLPLEARPANASYQHKLPIKGIQPLPQAHSFNDFLQRNPLFDALNCGFTSLESDIYIVPKTMSAGISDAEFVSTTMTADGNTIINVYGKSTGNINYNYCYQIGKENRKGLKWLNETAITEANGRSISGSKFVSAAISGDGSRIVEMHMDKGTYYYLVGRIGKDSIKWGTLKKFDTVSKPDPDSHFISVAMSADCSRLIAIYPDKETFCYKTGTMLNDVITWSNTQKLTNPDGTPVKGDGYISIAINRKGTTVLEAHSQDEKFYYQTGTFTQDNKITWKMTEPLINSTTGKQLSGDRFISASLTDSKALLAFRSNYNYYWYCIGSMSGDNTVAWEEPSWLAEKGAPFISVAASGTRAIEVHNELHSENSLFNYSQALFSDSTFAMTGLVHGKYKGSLYNLYLKDIIKQLGKNKFAFDGYNYPITLVIGMKTRAPGSIEFMNSFMAKYSNVINSYNFEKKDNPVNIILNGYKNDEIREEDFDYLLNAKARYIAIEGRVDSPLSGQDKYAKIFPQVSDDWNTCSKERLADIVRNAHEKGWKIRFRNTDNNKETWNSLIKAGADAISTDDIKGLRDFLTKKQGR